MPSSITIYIDNKINVVKTAVPLYCTLAGCLLRLQWVLYLDITFLVPMVIESSSLPTASPPCNCSAREKYPGLRLQSDSWVRLTNSFFSFRVTASWGPPSFTFYLMMTLISMPNLSCTTSTLTSSTLLIYYLISLHFGFWDSIGSRTTLVSSPSFPKFGSTVTSYCYLSRKVATWSGLLHYQHPTLWRPAECSLVLFINLSSSLLDNANKNTLHTPSHRSIQSCLYSVSELPFFQCIL